MLLLLDVDIFCNTVSSITHQCQYSAKIIIKTSIYQENIISLFMSQESVTFNGVRDTKTMDEKKEFPY